MTSSGLSERITVRLAECFGRELNWTRPQIFSRVHKLVSDRDTLAIMRWRGLRAAEGATATGNWSIRRAGLISLTGEVIDTNTHRTVLSIRSGFRAGTFETHGGETFHWKRTKLFRLEVAVSDANGTELFRAGGVLAFGRSLGRLTLSGAAANNPLLDPLVLAAWYVVHRLRQRRRRA
jgi:hypothetical protein